MNPMYFYISALYKYLLDNLPDYSEILFLEAIPQGDIQRFILIADLGGEYEDAQQRFYSPEMLIVTQSTDPQSAKMLGLEVFDLVKQMHDFSVSFDYEWKGEIKNGTVNFARIMAGSTPSPQGNTGNGLFQYVTVLKLSVCDAEDPE